MEISGPLNVWAMLRKRSDHRLCAGNVAQNVFAVRVVLNFSRMNLYVIQLLTCLPGDWVKILQRIFMESHDK